MAVLGVEVTEESLDSGAPLEARDGESYRLSRSPIQEMISSGSIKPVYVFEIDGIEFFPATEYGRRVDYLATSNRDH